MNKRTLFSFLIVAVFSAGAFAVGIINKKASSSSAISDSTQNNNNQTAGSVAPVGNVSTQVQSATQVKVTKAPVKAKTPATVYRGESESESGDDDGGYSAPVSAPVSAPATIPASTPTPVADIPKSQSTSPYKDGTYTASANYDSPGGMDSISVTVTLKNGIVTDVSVNPVAGDRTSARYQAAFVSGYKTFVVGKPLDSIYLTNVSGSSLTPIGFNAALAAIKTQAKA